MLQGLDCCIRRDYKHKVRKIPDSPMLTILRQLGYVAAVAVVCFYAFVALRGPHGVPRMIEKKQQLERMEGENEKLRQDIRKHEEFIRKLENDPEVRDRVIREKTNRQKPDETTIYLQEPAAPAQSGR